MSEEIYLVGISDCESGSIYYACKTYETALKKWNFLRCKCIEENEEHIIYYKDNPEEWSEPSIKMYEEMNNKLSNTDPDTINNYPHEAPFIQKIKLLE